MTISFNDRNGHMNTGRLNLYKGVADPRSPIQEKAQALNPPTFDTVVPHSHNYTVHQEE